ncbi:aminomethyl transferase family protein [Dactylosporangium sp. CA-092794]|uniref:aminomethyl transferase family protein n=1 Tax=Dactylosporangium sp. CA-092794 TaxID=3239929 RepID=UPI003D8A50D8
MVSHEDSLQAGIDRAGSPVGLLWKPNPPAWTPPILEPEYTGWRAEQGAWLESVAIADLSYHMWDTFLSGPGALPLLSDLSANNYRDFAYGQAKQFLPVTESGHIVVDGILLREAEDRFVLSGVPPAHSWLQYHADRGDYDVEWTCDPSMEFRPGEVPRLFRFQIQGPRAADLIERAFGGPLPPLKFFHSVPVELGGRRFRALRHGMAGQPGCEFIGDYADHDRVWDALLAAGEPLGLERIGAITYPTSSPTSGWIPCPLPGIYSDPALADYRRTLPLLSFEGQIPLHGTYYSPDVEDYYVTPYDLGYGRFVSFDHEFIGRDALLAAGRQQRRTKVTLVFDAGQLAPEDGGVYTLAINRVERDGELIGTTAVTTFFNPMGVYVGLAVLDSAHATPGSRVEVAWGEHPGPGAAAGVLGEFPRLTATVAPAPYDTYARAQYRTGVRL